MARRRPAAGADHAKHGDAAAAAALANATRGSIRRLREDLVVAERRGDCEEAERLRASLEVRAELLARIKRGLASREESR